jgi:transposase
VEIRTCRGAEFQKKSIQASEQQRPDVASRRAWWKKYQGRLDPRRLVFIDETWTKTNMAPLRGWGLKGKRLPSRVPHGHWQTMTFLAALRHDRIVAPCVFDGPINGQTFQLYVEQFLVPTLKPGDIVIMDNLGSHRGNAIRSAIRRRGARERTIEATWRRIGALLKQFSKAECRNYLTNAGYGSA